MYMQYAQQMHAAAGSDAFRYAQTTGNSLTIIINGLSFGEKLKRRNKTRSFKLKFDSRFNGCGGCSC